MDLREREVGRTTARVRVVHVGLGPRHPDSGVGFVENFTNLVPEIWKSLATPLI